MNNYQVLAKSISYQLGMDLLGEEKNQVQHSLSQTTELIELAEVHGIAPFFYQFIKRNEIQVKDEFKRQLQSLTIRHKYAAKARSEVLLLVNESFAENNIKVVLLKGAALAQMIYSEPIYRPMRDIDILISKADQIKAKYLLEELGFVFDKAHASVYMGEIHHLPNAIKQVNGLKISLEVHHQIYSRDVEGSQTFEQIIENSQLLENDSLTLNHKSMLNHLCRHTFSLAPEVRLIHQYDILGYADKYFDEIPWQKLKQENHFIINTICCLQYSLYFPEKLKSLIGETNFKKINGVGEAMLPYTQILSKNKSIYERWSAVFSPSPWWMHVNYNIAPEKSLIWCYLFTHPKRVIKDITMRLFYAARNSLRKIK